MTTRPRSRTASSARRRAPSLPRYLRLQRNRPIWLSALGLVVMLALIFADRRGLLLAQGGDLSRYDGQLFAVVRVVDGDTLDVAAPDGDSPVTRIRLWGIDTPELSRSATTPNEPFADEATDFARQLLDGQQVRLILEPHDQRDKYGRLLAYVQLPDGTLFNERLLAAGLARYEDRFSHRHMQRFAMLELQARNEKVGLWNPRP